MKGLFCWYLAKISNPLGWVTFYFPLLALPEEDFLPATYRTITLFISLFLAYLAAKFVAKNYETYFISLYSWFSSRINFLQTKTGYIIGTFLASFCNTATVVCFIFYIIVHSK